jgi:hypothetical protein
MLWLIIGALVALGAVALFRWLGRRGLSPRWYVWVLMVLGLLNLLFAIEAVAGSIREAEPAAAFRLAVLGLVLLAITWGPAWWLTVKRQVARPVRAGASGPA